jgi:hypothetical protein
MSSHERRANGMDMKLAAVFGAIRAKSTDL